MSVSVIIDGKKYELEAPAHRANLQAGVTLLALGDYYKAKLVQDLHKTTHESSQADEFLFPDKKTRKFFVVGQTAPFEQKRDLRRPTNPVWGAELRMTKPLFAGTAPRVIEADYLWHRSCTLQHRLELDHPNF